MSIGEAGTGVQLIRVWDGSALFATQFPAGTDLAAIRGTVAAGVVTAIEQDAERPLR